MKDALDEAAAPAEGAGADAEGELPAEFLTHAAEAFDAEASPEDRARALYRAIQSCH